MYGVLILSHGELANALLSTSKLIIGEQENVATLGLEASESRQDYQTRLIETCEKLETKEGLLILADLYGGTPANAAVLALFGRYPNLYIVTGTNLAMVIEALLSRTYKSIEKTVEALEEAGKQGIVNVGSKMEAHSETDE